MAITVPKLPAGWVAQMASHRDIGDLCYEFRRVYDDKNKLHPDHSYWLITPIGDDHGVETGSRTTQAISFGAYQEQSGVLGYDAFSSPTVPVDELSRWTAGNIAPAAAH